MKSKIFLQGRGCISRMSLILRMVQFIFQRENFDFVLGSLVNLFTRISSS